MRRLGLVILYTVLGLVGFIGVYMGADAVLSRIPAYDVGGEVLPPKYEVYILSNGVHTDIVLPVKTDLMDWGTVFPMDDVKRKEAGYRFVAIGWGDKGFYLNTPEWKDLKASTALVAALGIGETAVHVTYYHKMLVDEYCYRVEVDSVQLLQLRDYILASLDTDDKGNAILIHTDAQYGYSDAFYEARGAYSIFYSCNTWTNQGLKKAGMPSGIWTVFDKGILRHYQK